MPPRTRRAPLPPDEADDRLEGTQAQPAVESADAGHEQGGSLSVSRLVDTVGRFVGLGSPRGDSTTNNPSDLHTTLGTGPAPAVTSTDSSHGILPTGAPRVKDERDDHLRAAADEAREFARVLHDSIARQLAAPRDYNDAIFRMNAEMVDKILSFLTAEAGDLFEDDLEKYRALFADLDPDRVHPRQPDHLARTPAPTSDARLTSEPHPIKNLGTFPPSCPASPPDAGAGAVPATRLAAPAAAQAAPDAPTILNYATAPADPHRAAPAAATALVSMASSNGAPPPSGCAPPAASAGRTPFHAPSGPHHYAPAAPTAPPPAFAAPPQSPSPTIVSSVSAVPLLPTITEAAARSSPISLATPPPPFYFNAESASGPETPLPPWQTAILNLAPRSPALLDQQLKAAGKSNGLPLQLRRQLERCHGEPLYYLTTRAQIVQALSRLYLVVILAEAPAPLGELSIVPNDTEIASALATVHAALCLALDETALKTLLTARARTLDKYALAHGHAVASFIQYLDKTFLDPGTVHSTVRSFYTYDPPAGADALTVLGELETMASLRGLDDNTVIHVFTALLDRLDCNPLLAHLGTTSDVSISEYRRLIGTFPNATSTPLKPVPSGGSRRNTTLATIPSGTDGVDGAGVPPAAAPGPDLTAILNPILERLERFTALINRPGPAGGGGANSGGAGSFRGRDRLDTVKIYPILFPNSKYASDPPRPTDMVGAECAACEATHDDHASTVWINFDPSTHGERPDGSKFRLPPGTRFKHGAGRCVCLARLVDQHVAQNPDHAWMKRAVFNSNRP